MTNTKHRKRRERAQEEINAVHPIYDAVVRQLGAPQ